MDYVAAAEAHELRIKALFGLYNEERFDEMLTHFNDDVVCFLPTVLQPTDVDIRWSMGKSEYRRNLQVFRGLFGRLEVDGVFATGHGSSVMVTDERGNSGTFSFEVGDDRTVRRVFFHHQPGRAAKVADVRSRTDAACHAG